MQSDGLLSVSRGVLKHHILQSLDRYWPENRDLIDRLPIVEQEFPLVSMPLQLVNVELPSFGAKWGVSGSLVVPRECCNNPDNPIWEEVDWWLASFLLLECWHERVWEEQHGVIHSYSFRLKGWDKRVWDKAWVNRIALFLREWAAVNSGEDASTLFGTLPKAEIVMTHDVDAVAKTWSIRLKQSAFLGFNAVRLLSKCQPGLAGRRLGQAFKFLFSRAEWWMLDIVTDMEQRAGIRSQFNFYADNQARNLKRWIFDPGYDIAEPRLRNSLGMLKDQGWHIGLHQAFDSWRSPDLMREQKTRLETFVSGTVSSCRQHWLRFSWQDTWAAQAAAGFEQDMTLMFNDRAGFRAAAALSWAPWNHNKTIVHNLSVTPTVFMDSHFYDYQPMSSAERRLALQHWLDEIILVGGQVAVLWHPHTITSDYGWTDGFQELIKYMSKKALCPDL
jgi:hypothetical protein